MILKFKEFINESLIPNQISNKIRYENVYKTNHIVITQEFDSNFVIYINREKIKSVQTTLEESIKEAKKIIDLR